jgi:hypothetical protein
LIIKPDPERHLLLRNLRKKGLFPAAPAVCMVAVANKMPVIVSSVAGSGVTKEFITRRWQRKNKKSPSGEKGFGDERLLSDPHERRLQPVRRKLAHPFRISGAVSISGVHIDSFNLLYNRTIGFGSLFGFLPVGVGPKIIEGFFAGCFTG